jgi:predicted nucleic acid-binding protein
MTEKTLVDTNILVYAYERPSEKHETAMNTLRVLMHGGNGMLSVQKHAEFACTLSEKTPQPNSRQETRNIINELSVGFNVVSYEAQTVADALSLGAIHGLRFFDALIVATMEKEGIRTIVTEDSKHFKKVPWLTVINPFEGEK